MKPNLLKYKIGLVVLALLTVGLVGFVLVQASATKQDTKTNNAANNIAGKLNDYIETNNVVPSTVAQAGAKNVPSSITYQKLSASSYKFCATYKSASSGFDAAGAVADVASGGTADTSSDNFTDTSDLFIDSTYHKGANCQTIKPYIAQIQPGGLCTSATLTSICVPGSSNSKQGGASIKTSTNLCGYNPKTYSDCSVRCTQSTQSNVLNVTDDTISTVTTVGKTTTLDVTDTKGTKHTVTLTSETKLYDSSCQSTTADQLLQGDQIRVVVVGGTVKVAQGPKVIAAEIDDFSL